LGKPAARLPYQTGHEPLPDDVKLLMEIRDLLKSGAAPKA